MYSSKYSSSTIILQQLPLYSFITMMRHECLAVAGTWMGIVVGSHWTTVLQQ